MKYSEVKGFCSKCQKWIVNDEQMNIHQSCQHGPNQIYTPEDKDFWSRLIKNKANELEMDK